MVEHRAYGPVVATGGGLFTQAREKEKSSPPTCVKFGPRLQLWRSSSVFTFILARMTFGRRVSQDFGAASRPGVGQGKIKAAAATTTRISSQPPLPQVRYLLF